jgi:hypothetical protein
MSETTTETPTEPVTPEVPVATTENEPLGEAGLAALKAERDARAAAEKKLKEFEDRDKTEAERQQEERDALRKENAQLKSEKLRTDVATAKGVPAALLSGSTKEELEASATALLEFKGSTGSNPLHVPSEGKNPRPQPSNETEFVSSLFGQGD